MKALLLVSVPKLGQSGDIVNVADGYFRNVLLKQKLAIPATTQHQKQADAREALEKKKRIEEAEKWKETFERLKSQRITLSRKANPQGHLFAKVSPDDIATHLSKTLAGTFVDPSWISIDQPIKTLGEHAVIVTIPHLPGQRVEVEITAE